MCLWVLLSGRSEREKRMKKKQIKSSPIRKIKLDKTGWACQLGCTTEGKAATAKWHRQLLLVTKWEVSHGLVAMPLFIRCERGICTTLFESPFSLVLMLSQSISSLYSANCSVCSSLFRLLKHTKLLWHFRHLFPNSLWLHHCIQLETKTLIMPCEVTTQ